MKLFFGKISKTVDMKQISEGYYQAPKGSSWFSSLEIGDYCYIIGGDRIQFWKAKEWEQMNGVDRLYFEILSPDLGISVNDLIALSFLKLSKALIVLTSRSARNRAFFEIEMLNNYPIADLSNPHFYKSPELYRCIKVTEEDKLPNDTKDIQLFQKNESLHIQKAPFFEESVYALFRDNLKFKNQGQKNKDGTLNKIANKLGENFEFVKSEISLRAFYDAFFCDYIEKVNHFLVGAFWDEHNPQDLTSTFVNEKRWANGYDGKFLNEVNSIAKGCYIAIKSAYVKAKTTSVMMIKARGIVTKNHQNGRDLDIDWEDDFKPFEVEFGGYRQTVKGVTNKDHIDAIWIEEIENNGVNDMESEYVSLIKYKKQIILQGPPGTGKTKLAIEIADQLINGNNAHEKIATLNAELIKSILREGQIFKSAHGNTSYSIKGIDTTKIVLIGDDIQEKNITFNKIIDFYNTERWKNPLDNGNDRGAAAVAKFIFENNSSSKVSFENSEQFKLIQFHPSFGYEDFVRGITAKPSSDGSGIEYEAENKVLGLFAKKANENYLESRLSAKEPTFLSDLELFREFIEELKDQIADSSEHKYPLTDAVYLFDADEKRFKYKGDNWIAHEKGLNMKFSELEKILIAKITERSGIKKLEGIEELTRQHASYFIKIIEKFYAYKKQYKATAISSKQVEEKNYVLIIDEINRANLSSVLGELIYALEYRGVGVESMYDVDGESLILPPNLYIIGTMNTADRSVGHIDYAIRRRFAFVDVLPETLAKSTTVIFDEVLFKKVEGLFNHDSYLSKEFDPKDVQLGHSYFIDKSKEGGTIAIRLKYEIKPILIEYVKDGILVGEDILEVINNL